MHQFRRLRRALAAVLTLAAALAAASLAPAMAKEVPGADRDPVTQEQALNLARATFLPPEGSGEPEVNLLSFGGRPTYNLWWRRGNTLVQSVGVAQATGEITAFSRTDLDRLSLETQARTVSEATALATASELVQRLAPARWPGLTLWRRAEAVAYFNPYGGGLADLGQYAFVWVEKAEAAPVPENSVRVAVDRQSGAVTSYRLFWNDKLQLASGTPAMDPDAARAQLLQAGDLELAWLPQYDAGQTPTGFVLAWRPRLDLDLDAISGVRVDAAGRPADPQALLATVPLPAITPAPSVRLDRDGARALARSLLGLPADLPARYESGSEREFSFYWEVEQPPRGAITYQLTYRPDLGAFSAVSRGAPKAAVLDPSIGLGDNSEIPNLSPDAARDKAIALAAGWYPAYLGSLRLRGSYQVAQQGFGPVRLDGYTFHFERLADGVPVQGDGLTVTIEAKTGEWLSAHLSWSPLPMAAAPTPASPAAALAAWGRQREAVLIYARPRLPDAPYATWEPVQGSPAPAALIWRLLPPEGVPGSLVAAALDAVSLDPLDARGQSLAAMAAALQALEHHWARRELQTMLQWNALGQSGDGLSPKASLTRIEALRLLVAGYLRRFPGGGPGRSPWRDLPADDPRYGYAQAALDAALLDPPGPEGRLWPDTPLNRGEFFVLAARSLGFGPLLTAPLTVAPPFADLAAAPPPVQRAAALLAALDVVRGSGGRCRPDDPVSRAEAAAMVVRLLLADPPY